MSLTRFEEDSSVDLGKLGYGNTRVIRSHRREPKYSSKRITGVVLAVTITATVLTTSVDTLEHPIAPAVAIAALSTVEVPTIALPQQVEVTENRAHRADRPSRSAGRPASNKLEIVITFALAQQGDPYSWAKSGPNAYDCSGLVMRAFAQAGITLPHYTGTMINRGVKVSQANLKRGDIVFPTSGHVGIYLGSNKMVIASSGKGMVVTQTVYSFYAARRIL